MIVLALVAAAAGSVLFAPAGTSQAAQSPSTTAPPGLLGEVLGNLLSPPPADQGSVSAPTPPTPPPPTPEPSPATPEPAVPAPDPPTQAPSAEARVIPPEYQAIINSGRPRSAPRSTTALLDALRRLEDLGFTSEEAAVMGMGRFPVAGLANYRDDWHDPRFGPPFHLHKGTDIFAARGTPILSPANGKVRFEDGGLGGRAVYVTAADGTYYYMAHINDYGPSLYSGAPVEQGQVVAYVGSSGNAEGGAPHLHLQIHPQGGAPVNPKPIVDRWLTEALDAAPALLSSYGVDVPRSVTAVGQLRRFDEGGLEGSGRPPETALLWASSVTAGGGTVGLAEMVAVRVAGGIDWENRATAAEQQADIRHRARAAAGSLLLPVTPPVVGVLLGPEFSLGSS